MSQHKKVDDEFTPGFLKGLSGPPSEEEIARISESFVQFIEDLFPELVGKTRGAPTADDVDNIRIQYKYFLGKYPEDFKHSYEGFVFIDHINRVLGYPAKVIYSDQLRLFVAGDPAEQAEDSS